MKSAFLLCLFAAAGSAATITLPEVVYSGSSTEQWGQAEYGRGGGRSGGATISIWLTGTDGFSLSGSYGASYGTMYTGRYSGTECSGEYCSVFVTHPDLPTDEYARYASFYLTEGLGRAYVEFENDQYYIPLRTHSIHTQRRVESNRFDEYTYWSLTTTTYTFNPVPEPSTLAITALGLSGLIWRRKRNR